LLEKIVLLDPGTTKNDEPRVVPMAPDLYQALAMQYSIRQAKHPESPWVFSRDGERILDLRGSWEAACKVVGLFSKDEDKPTKLFHDLRRTGVRNLIRAGVPERVAMAISGHKTRAIFDRYNITSEADLKDAARRLGEYFAQKTKESESRHTIGTQAPKVRPEKAN
jgi:integrase